MSVFNSNKSVASSPLDRNLLGKFKNGADFSFQAVSKWNKNWTQISMEIDNYNVVQLRDVCIWYSFMRLVLCIG